MQRRANLFIVGAMKAGTTSFSNMLAQHPLIYFSPVKEPNFFVDEFPFYTPSKFFSLDEYFKNKFPKPLHIAHIKSRKQYDVLFSKALPEHKYLAEGSTSYFHSAESAEKIYSYNPHSKIIVLLRNGFKRALSHYKMDVSVGRTTSSFEKKLEADWNAYQNGNLSNWSYLGMSLYYDNVTRYKKIFKKNLLILNLEELISNEKEALKKVFDFLQLDVCLIELTHRNESTDIRFKKALFWLHKSGIKDVLSYLLPVKVRHAAFDLLRRKSSSIKISKDFKDQLLSLFKNDIKKIQQEC